jgi:3-oxoacyl-[acyl-carrier protein] reductase
MNFNGKVAIVTGAGKGIGKETAIQFAKAGAKVVVAGRSEQPINETMTEIKKITKDVITVLMDVSKFADAEKTAKAAVDKFGKIDILVNNAGIDIIDKTGKRFGSLDILDEDYDRLMFTNLKGQYNCMKAVIPSMLKQNYGRIVNISSTTGITGAFGTAPYCATKAGIMAQTKVFATEFGKNNIIVNCVAPGMVDTPMHTYTPHEMFDMVAQRLPLGRVGQPIDIATVILFFASEDIYFTGQTLAVDGGGTMR